MTAFCVLSFIVFVGNKSVSIHSAIANGGFAKVDGIPEAVVQQETRPLSSPVTPIVPPAVLDGGLHNPVVLSSSSTPARVRDEVHVFFWNVFFMVYSLLQFLSFSLA